MQTYKLALALASALLFFNACRPETGTGAIEKEARPLSDFTRIALTNAAALEVFAGNDYLVEVSDHGNLLPFLATEVRSGELGIRNSPSNVMLRNSKALIEVTMPTVLNRLTCTGSGSIKVFDAMPGLQQVTVTGSGSTDANPADYTGTLEAVVSGSGSIRMDGSAPAVRVTVSGSGSVDFSALATEEATCTVSGSGNVRVKVSGTLNVTISGSGDVFYIGDPAVINATVTGSGQLIKL